MIFFIKVDELLGRWCSGVSLEGQHSMSIQVKLLATVIGLSVGLTLICGVAAYAIAYEARGAHVLAALRGRIPGLILGEVALASLIGWQITGLVGPLREVARALRRLARGGRELDHRVAVLTRDEIGEVAWWFNRFVDAMRGRASFKRAVEDDRDLDEVYARIYKLLREGFGVREVVIYEVNNSRNRMSPVGEVEARWCCPEVLVDVGRCRAVRTARPVSSLEEPEICFSFTCPGERRHVCIPMVVGGYIGNVVQLVFGPEVEAQEAQAAQVPQAPQAQARGGAPPGRLVVISGQLAQLPQQVLSHLPGRGQPVPELQQPRLHGLQEVCLLLEEGHEIAIAARALYVYQLRQERLSALDLFYVRLQPLLNTLELPQ